MGVDWYSFKAICSSGYAIMVTNKDIKECHRPGSSSTPVDDKDRIDDPLDKVETAWVLDHAPGFNAYQLGQSFVLFMKGHNDMWVSPGIDVPGYHGIIDDWIVDCDIEEAPKGEEYSELLELARKLTPSGSKLSFAPGKYSFAATDNDMIALEQLKRSGSSSDCTREEEKADKNEDSKDHVQPEMLMAVPSDFELIVGNGDKKKTIGTNRALLFCCFPHLETLVSDALEAMKLELPELDPEAVQVVLDAYSSRKEVKLPSSSSDLFKAFQIVKEKFGMSETKDSPTKKEHPAIADSRWLDATFLAGPNKEEIKVNRSVLASMNPVLNRILFGTGVISVYPSNPIEWPDFDAQAVRLVFLALVHRGWKEFVVPLESVDSVEVLVDYLMETREDLMLSYDTPFKPEYQRGFLLARGRHRSGLKFNE